MRDMPVISLTGQIRSPMAPFGVDAVAGWWWSSLREVFPTVGAAVVLPSGFEIVAEVADPDAAFGAVVVRAARLTRRLRAARPVWRPIPSPRVTTDPGLGQRWVRAALARPCALRLAAVPPLWRWSTARDLVGAACDPWVNPAEVATACGEPGLEWSLSPSKEPPPPTPLAVLARAAIEATRGEPPTIRSPGAARNVFVWLAVARGWSVPKVANACGMSPCRTARIAAEPNGAWLTAASRWLDDPWLRSGTAGRSVQMV